jgi:hypothetical protein
LEYGLKGKDGKFKMMNEQAKAWYRQVWGNFKSDKWKSIKTLRSEISDLLSIGNLSKKQLIKIKDFIKEQLDEI